MFMFLAQTHHKPYVMSSEIAVRCFIPRWLLVLDVFIEAMNRIKDVILESFSKSRRVSHKILPNHSMSKYNSRLRHWTSSHNEQMTSPFVFWTHDEQYANMESRVHWAVRRISQIFVPFSPKTRADIKKMTKSDYFNLLHEFEYFKWSVFVFVYVRKEHDKPTSNESCAIFSSATTNNTATHFVKWWRLDRAGNEILYEQ